MPVTVKDVEHVAALARLEFSDDEKEKFTHQLNEILEYMEKLNELDTSGVEPLSHVTGLSPESRQASTDSNSSRRNMREDVARPSSPQEEMLMNAPDRNEKFFKVPKVIR